MSIRVTCEKCGVVLKVKEELAGTKGKCPACRGTLNVPTLEQAAAAAPLSASETAPTAAVGDTGAIKIPAKPKSAKVAASPGDSTPPPPVGSNGSPADHAAEVKAPPQAESRKSEKPQAEKPPASASESTTDDLAEPAPEAKPAPSKTAGKSKLRMSDTDADDAPAAPTPSKPAETAAPAAEARTPPPAPKSEEKPAAEKPKDGDFDLDSFLMEGPKPKALPPVKEEPAKKGGPAPRGGSGRKLSMSDDETNVSGPSETLPPPNRRASAAESAMAALTGGGTSSSAKDLLAKATQEGRARAASMPDDARERFDYAGAIKTIGKEYGLHVLGTIALCGVLYFGMNYMLGSNTELPPLARVYGRVTVKKQPIEGVIVTFTPIGAKDAKDSGTKLKKGAPRAATGVTDKDGNYELMYMEGIRGAVIGQNRVWIDPFTFENSKKLPANYQSAATSGDVREVKATGGEENIDL